MKTLQISEANARKLYQTAAPEFKQTLKDTFGKEFFSQSITERGDWNGETYPIKEVRAVKVGGENIKPMVEYLTLAAQKVGK